MENSTDLQLHIPPEFNFVAERKIAEGESNDVYFGYGVFNSNSCPAYVKINKNPKISLLNENNRLQQLAQSGINAPAVLWHGCINRETIILQALKGNMLWDYIDPRRKLYAQDKILAYLYEYGRTLAEIHNLPLQCEKQIRQKLYNIMDEEKNDDYGFKEIVEWLKNQNIVCNYNTFVHGDYNLANLLIYEDKVSGVIDWEFAGMGWKEYDLAWALRARLTFLNKADERAAILEGYLSLSNYDEHSLRWCEVLNYLHFAVWSKNSYPDYTVFSINKAKGLISEKSQFSHSLQIIPFSLKL